MSGVSIHGTGRQHRDDAVNRVREMILKGQAVTLGGFYNQGMQKLMDASPNEVSEVLLDHPNSNLRLIICGRSKCGGPDVCG
jgi:hypothetical protein